MLRQKLGVVLFSLGAMSGDSEKLMIPLLIILIGVCLVIWGEHDK